MNQYVSSQSELRKRTFVGTTDYSRKERASGTLPWVMGSILPVFFRDIYNVVYVNTKIYTYNICKYINYIHSCLPNAINLLAFYNIPCCCTQAATLR